MSTTPDTTTAIRKTRSVPIPPEAAFELFTTRMGAWWPLDSHALSDTATDVRWDDHVGGRVVEIDSAGTEYPWAEITVWDPPRRLALAWHLDRDRATATTVDVRFEPAAAGCTVHLEHSGWENMGEAAVEARAGYTEGWEPVLDLLVDAAG